MRRLHNYFYNNNNNLVLGMNAQFLILSTISNDIENFANPNRNLNAQIIRSLSNKTP